MPEKTKDNPVAGALYALALPGKWECFDLVTPTVGRRVEMVFQKCPDQIVRRIEGVVMEERGDIVRVAWQGGLAQVLRPPPIVHKSSIRFL